MDDLTTPRTRGPHPGILALISTGLFIGSLVSSAILTGGQTFVSPFAETATVAAYYEQNFFAARVSAMLQVAASVPLGIVAATLYSRQQRWGARNPGPVIGLVGGIGSSAMLALSGLLSWTISQPAVVAEPAVAHGMLLLSFAVGGVGSVLGMGLLVAGVAVPAVILRLLPGWLGWVGLVIAVLAELSFASLVVEPLQVLIPIGRFGGLAWLIAAGFLLPIRPSNPART